MVYSLPYMSVYLLVGASNPPVSIWGDSNGMLDSRGSKTCYGMIGVTQPVMRFLTQT